MNCVQHVRVCTSIVEKGVEEAVGASWDALRRGADMLEIRFDAMVSLPSDLSAFDDLPVPLIATLRPLSQGGMFRGDEEERIGFFERVAEHFDLLDLELESELPIRLRGRGRVICSSHRFEPGASVNEIVQVMESAAACGDLAKGAFMVGSITDLHSLVVASRLLRARLDGFILIGMGNLGKLTRIRAQDLGSFLTYTSLQGGKEAGPGQLSIDAMRCLSKGVILGIIGWPLSHSLSPPMHRSALRHMGVEGTYLSLPTAPGELDMIVEIVRGLGLRGINVTIPHKEAILPMLDEVDPLATRIGAVNTVLNRGGRLIGSNTDLDGVEMTFKEAGVDPRGKSALVIGAGGAARTCCFFLAGSGARVDLINRTRERATMLANSIPGVKVIERDEAEKGHHDIVINCTPLGMKGFPQVSPVDPKVFREGQFVLDTIYNPPKTRFLMEAESRGATTRSGIEMLIYQAISAFEIWMGLRPPYEVMADPLKEERG